MDWLDWLNKNSGAIVALASVLLATVTIAYVFFTYRLVAGTAALTKKTQELVVETKTQGRPYVFIEVVRRGGLLDTVLSNAGQRSAKNILLEVVHDIVVPSYDQRGFLGWPMFQRQIPFLRPGGRVSQQVAHYEGILKQGLGSLDEGSRIIKYVVSYQDGDQSYSDSYDYDLSFLLPEGGDPFPYAGNELALIRLTLKEQLQNLAGALREYSRRQG